MIKCNSEPLSSEMRDVWKQFLQFQKEQNGSALRIDKMLKDLDMLASSEPTIRFQDIDLSSNLMSTRSSTRFPWQPESTMSTGHLSTELKGTQFQYDAQLQTFCEPNTVGMDATKLTSRSAFESGAASNQLKLSPAAPDAPTSHDMQMISNVNKQWKMPLLESQSVPTTSTSLMIPNAEATSKGHDLERKEVPMSEDNKHILRKCKLLFASKMPTKVVRDQLVEAGALDNNDMIELGKTNSSMRFNLQMINILMNKTENAFSILCQILLKEESALAHVLFDLKVSKLESIPPNRNQVQNAETNIANRSESYTFIDCRATLDYHSKNPTRGQTEIARRARQQFSVTEIQFDQQLRIARLMKKYGIFVSEFQPVPGKGCQNWRCFVGNQVDLDRLRLLMVQQEGSVYYKKLSRKLRKIVLPDGDDEIVVNLTSSIKEEVFDVIREILPKGELLDEVDSDWSADEDIGNCARMCVENRELKLELKRQQEEITQLQATNSRLNEMLRNCKCQHIKQ